MATRVVSTKFAIEGESEYRASVSRINGEIKTLQSALKLTESQYQTNANSMAALTAKGSALNDLFKAQESKVKELRAALENAKSAEEKYAAEKATLTAKIEANNKALEALRNTAGDTSEEERKLTEENKELAANLEKCDANLAAAGKGVNNWQTQLNNAEIKLNDLDAELKENDKYMDEAKNSADGCAKSIDEFGNRTKETQSGVDALAKALGAMGLAKAFRETVDALNACIQSSVEFESSMAGVAKTTDMSEEELSAMGDTIKEMATRIPLAATELAGIAEVAGQLGVAKEDLTQFTEVMANLGVATNLSAEEAATMLAQLTAITGMDTDFYSNLGSTVVALGNSFATNERSIVDMTQAIAAAATNAGMSESEMMALSAAVTSLGITSANGGTQMSKLVSEMQTAVETGEGLEGWARAAGMSAESFAKLWGENAVGALTAFIGNLNNLDDSANVTLETLGISETRMKTMITSLSNAESANKMLSSAIQTANTAWSENVALTTEAETRYETTESKFQLFKNSVENVKVAIGDQLTPALANLAETGADVTNWAAEFIEEHEAFAPALAAVVSVLGVLTVAVGGYTFATTAAIPAITAFNAALSANPAGAVVLGITAAIAALTALVAFLKDDAVPSVKELTTAAKDCNTAFEESESAFKTSTESIQGSANLARDYANRLSELEGQVKSSKSAEFEYKMVVDQLNQLYPELNLAISENTGLVNKSTKEILGQIDALEDLALEQALQDRYTEQLKAYSAAQAECYTNEAKLSSAKKDHKRIEEEQLEIQKELVAISDQINAVYSDTTLSYIEQDAAVRELQNSQNELYSRYGELSEELRVNEKEQKNLNKAVEKGSETLEEYRVPVEEAQAALAQFEEEQEKARQAAESEAAAQKRAAEAITDLRGQMDNLAQKYKEAYDSAYESINAQIGLFDDFAASISEDTDSVEKMMERWNAQTQNLATYTENLKLAAQYGLDEGLISSLSDGSTESAGYISTIIEKITELGGSTEGMSAEAAAFVDEFNASFARTKDARDSFSDTIGIIESGFYEAVASMEQAAAEIDFSGFKTAMEDAFANVGVDFNTIGKNVGTGMEQGIEEKTGAVKDAAKDMAQGAVDGALETTQEHSPSRVTREIGENFDQGMIDGINAKRQAVNSAVKDLTDEICRLMKESSATAVRDYVQEFSKLPNETRNQINQLKSSISSTMSSMPSDMQSVGQQIVNGMITGMNNRSSALYSTVRSIVNSAIAAAKTAAQTASPSKKTTKIFEDVGEGMVVGLENKRKRISETAQNVVDDALKLDVSGKIEAAINGIDDRMPEARRTPEEGGGNTTYRIENKFQIEKVEVRDDTDIQRIAQELYNLEQKEMRKRGVSK